MYSALNYGSTGENNEQKSTDVNSMKKKQKTFFFSYCSLDLSSFLFFLMFHFMFSLHMIIIYMYVLSFLSLLVRDTTWKSICEKKKRKIACLWSWSERESGRSVFFPSLPSSTRSENATKCKSSHVLKTFTAECRNNWTNCFYWWIHTNQQQVWF